jgi:putative ABC transport system permease protein
VRDFAVFKATGAPARTVVGGLLVQSTFLSLVAAVLAVGIAQVVRLGLPFPSEIEAGSVGLLGAIAIAVSVLASFAGVRRALSTDPAVAVGAAA